MLRRWRAPLISALALLFAASAGATPFDNRPKILLHLRPATSRNACAEWGRLSDCTTAEVQGELNTPSFAYILAARGGLRDIAGLQCGISYTSGIGRPDDHVGIDIFSWTLCATLEFPTGGPDAWLRSGGGNMITWDWTENCQSGETAVAGWFYLTAYGYDQLVLGSRPVDGLAKVAGCDTRETLLTEHDLGDVQFGGGLPGCNPCATICQYGDPIFPGGSYVRPSIVAHVTPEPTVTCDNLSMTCAGANSRGTVASGGADQYVYLLSYRGDYGAVRAVEFGIDYDGGRADGVSDGHGLDIVSWTSCGVSQSSIGNGRSWPAPHSGLHVEIDSAEDCLAADLKLIGYFFVTAWEPDTLRVIAPPGDAVAHVLHCVGITQDIPALDRLGRATFGAAGDCSPCREGCAPGVPAKSITWSGIKTLFGP